MVFLIIFLHHLGAKKVVYLECQRLINHFFVSLDSLGAKNDLSEALAIDFNVKFLDEYHSFSFLSSLFLALARAAMRAPLSVFILPLLSLSSGGNLSNISCISTSPISEFIRF